MNNERDRNLHPKTLGMDCAIAHVLEEREPAGSGS